jgi:hypothetical protein
MTELLLKETRPDALLVNCCKETVRNMVATYPEEMADDGTIIHCNAEKRGTAWIRLEGKVWRFRGSVR